MAGKLNIPAVKSYDDIFRSVNESSKDVIDVPLGKLREFGEHPFKVRDDTDMAELVESVRAEGIMVPLLVRALGADGSVVPLLVTARGGEVECYQIIAGHRRKRAPELAGLEAVPCMVRELSDDDAIAYMVDTNLARSKVLPSEKAWAYKLKLDAMKRQVGRKKGNGVPMAHPVESDLDNGVPLAHQTDNKKSREILAEQIGESQDQIRRYIRLTELLPKLLDRVDNEQISVRAGVELSYMLTGGQQFVEDVLAEYERNGAQVGVSIKQGEALRLASEAVLDELDVEHVRELLVGPPRPLAKDSPPKNFLLRASRVMSYFPADTRKEDMEDIVYRLLSGWKRGEFKVDTSTWN